MMELSCGHVGLPFGEHVNELSMSKLKGFAVV